jgi:hypothetical protein
VGVGTGRGAAARLARDQSPLALATVSVRAWAAALAGAPRVLAERRRVRGAARLSDAGFYRLLDAFRLTAREVALKD